MQHFETITQKIMSLPELQRHRNSWQENQQKVVFTNGCFDLLHYGHIHYLAAAADLGNRLVIGLNSDTSIQRLKGIHRPIKDEKNRAHILAALAFVDAVVLFESDTPYDLIEALQPDILVKGGDWETHQIVGADLVKANGGMVYSLPFIEGYSTTVLEQKIRNAKR